MNETEEYKKINEKIIKLIEENYLKDFFKEMKKFQIIMTGYNASKYKSLQVFKKYGWKLFVLSSAPHAMTFMLKNEAPSKVGIETYLLKDKKTGIVKSTGRDVYIIIKINETDELFEQIKSLERFINFITWNSFENNPLRYYFSHNEDGSGYILVASYPRSSL